MLTEPLTAVFTAAIVALLLLLANVFQRDIALFFAKPIPGVPDQAFNQTKSGQAIPNPLGNLINETWDERLFLAFNPLPLPTDYDSPFTFPALPTSSADTSQPPPTTLMISPLPSRTSTRSEAPSSARSDAPSSTSTRSAAPSSSGTRSETPSPVPDPTNIIPHSPGIDEYHLYT
ncbi:MAG: hypothetical protein L6R38_008852, partial [Xanthoria sp. 2 TBL-2021]